LPWPGYEVYDGNGKVNDVFSPNLTNLDGQILFSKERISGTYSVKADCASTSTYPELGVQNDLCIAPDGSLFAFLQTKPESDVTSGFELRGTAQRVGD
jgi:hypothetical protein